MKADITKYQYYKCISQFAEDDVEIDPSEVQGHIWDDITFDKNKKCACGLIKGSENGGKKICYYMQSVIDDAESKREPFLICPLTPNDHLVKDILV